MIIPFFYLLDPARVKIEINTVMTAEDDLEIILAGASELMKGHDSLAV